MSSRTNRALSIFVLLALLATAACSKHEAVKRYAMTGKVISVDANKPEVVVDSKEIPGFMQAMVMSYPVKDASLLKGIAAGDEISSTVVVEEHNYWLENIEVTKKASGAPPKTSQFRIPQPGDAVPNFGLVNQSGRRIALDGYHGKVVLLTFIYTRCPFPDYCPRVSSFFAQLNRKMLDSPELASRTHLLSVSFDTAHDTPAVLQKYGATYVGSSAQGFSHWDFAVPRQKGELEKMAQFFGLTYEPESGLITHSLSTTVIAPDGRIFRWYHGSDWTPDDLMKDVADALHSAG